MGYLIKSDVMNTIAEDRETSLMCYDDKSTKDIIKFCYESIEREIDKLPQHRIDSVTEEGKIINDFANWLYERHGKDLTDYIEWYQNR